MECELGSAGRGHLCHIVLRVGDHEVAVEEGGGVLPERLDDAGSCIKRRRGD